MKKIKVNADIYIGDEKLATEKYVTDVLPEEYDDTEIKKSITEIGSKVDTIANNSIPESYLEQAVDTYISNNDSGIATKEDINDLKSSLGLNTNMVTENYKNILYSSSYSTKTISNDYPYQAFGTETEIPAGKYLVYINADFNVTSLNARPITGFVSSTGMINGNYDDSNAPNPVVNVNAVGVEMYNIVTLTEATTVRPAINMRYISTSPTPSATISINNIFVCKLDKIDSLIINTIREEGNVTDITVTRTIITKKLYIDCIGDSLTYGVGSSTIKGGYVTRLQKKLGDEYIISNFGIGGETSHTIAARMGGIRPIIKAPFTIPSTVTESDEFEIICDDGSIFDCKDLNNSNSCVNPCEINGITGTLSKGSGNNKYKFTRSEQGMSETINRETTLITAGSKRKGNILIIYMGQNDGNYNADYLDLVKRCRRIVDIAETSQYIILGMTTGSYGTNGNDDRKNMEEAMFKEFGNHYINLREYMAHPIYESDGVTIKSCYSLDDLGLDPTTKDILNLLPNGYIPNDVITTDGTHGTDGYYDIVTNLIYTRGKELRYW